MSQVCRALEIDPTTWCQSDGDCQGQLQGCKLHPTDPLYNHCTLCTLDSHCPGSSVCAIGEDYNRCVECLEDSDCASGLCLDERCRPCGVKGWTCHPGATCNDSNDCANCQEDANCLSNLCENEVCVKCQWDSDCGPGRVCANSGVCEANGD